MSGREAQEQPVVDPAEWARMREQELVEIWKQVFSAELDRGTPIDTLRNSVRNTHRNGESAQHGHGIVPHHLVHHYIQAWRSYQKHTGTTVPMEDLQLRALDELEKELVAVERGSET